MRKEKQLCISFTFFLSYYNRVTMLDIKAIRQNPEFFKTALSRKGVDRFIIDELLAVDAIALEMQLKVEAFRARQNEVSQKLPSLPAGDEKQDLLAEMRELSDNKKKDEAVLAEADAKRLSILESLPNPPHETVPDGASDEENVVLRKEGLIRDFGFEAKEHWELAEALDILDTERSSKVSGSRFYYMKGGLAILQRALIQWAYMEVVKKGFTAVVPPFLTRKEAIYGTGYLSKDENYVVNPGEDDLYLIGTSEVPMTSYYAGETIDFSDGPHKFVSYSPCFRREAGSYGKDTKGIFRVHQFEKVEMVIFCRPEESEKMHEEIREIEEYLLRELEIPYQVVNVCCGDLGGSAAKKYDIEAWLPGQKKYREMTSTSICTDYQSRRLNIRYKKEDGKTEPVHVLNGTAVSSRPLVAILENYQNADGSIDIPKVLQPFCGFEKIG